MPHISFHFILTQNHHSGFNSDLHKRLPSPSSPNYRKANSFRAHAASAKEKTAVPFSSRKTFNIPATPNTKIEAPQRIRPKVMNSEKNLSKTQGNFKMGQTNPTSNKRLSIMEENGKRNVNSNKRNKRGDSSEPLENSKQPRSSSKNEPKTLTISNFEENVKNFQSEKTFENIILKTNPSPQTSPKHNSQSLNNIQKISFSGEVKNQETQHPHKNGGEGKKEGPKINDFLKLGEWNFQLNKKEFFLNNIGNSMNNKMLSKFSSRQEEPNKLAKQEENICRLNTYEGKENQPKNVDLGKEKRQTKLYQYILDH